MLKYLLDGYSLVIQNCTSFLICRIRSLVSYSRTSSLQENSSGVSSTIRSCLSNRVSNNPSHGNSERYAFCRQVDRNLWSECGESVDQSQLQEITETC